MYLYKKTNMVCFDSVELKRIFEAPSRQKLWEETQKSGYSNFELWTDRNKMQEIVDRVQIINNKRGKEDIEIFSALYIFPTFFPKESKICFLLEDGIDPIKTPIDSLEKLKKSLNEKSLTDFLFLTDGQLRAFQLKAYRGKMEVDEFFIFLKKKLLHYCNDLGKINLLISLTSGGEIIGNFFQDIHERLKQIELKGTGDILISYNEENKFDVMNTVYPILGTTRIKHEKFEQE